MARIPGRSCIVGAVRGMGGALSDEGADICLAGPDGAKTGEVARPGRGGFGAGAARTACAIVDPTRGDRMRARIGQAVPGRQATKTDNAGMNKPRHEQTDEFTWHG
ncbi:hypothetical protein C8N32_11826 [Rhodovulum imhoffii]|uniref:Uncharacterized protein n=1 Tax=Rhodovulum imhoffii TaxID=365340 RepID=A0A2T5BPR9_9RHOB|nr:hypothetical protein [Rhodovulum imhoffii]MBK5933585.1 hypothetical protein [Rhodovulum imhoffii]PTN01024.1 hypothetical protein C8N32_11826 [Rhodovulum imhoffii]